MASAAEQLASNLSWSSFAKADDLKKRILFALGALIVYRICTYIPLPGIDQGALQSMFEDMSREGGFINMINTFSGGALSRMSIIALNIMPYISASIIMTLMTSMVPSLAELKKQGERGRQQINQLTRYGTVVLTLFQAYGLAVGLQTQDGVVSNPGFFFQFSTVVTLVGGTMFLVWLGEQITQRGIGNGISLIIFAGIVAELPGAFATAFEMNRDGGLQIEVLVGILLGVAALIWFIVYCESAQRRIVINYPKRAQQHGGAVQQPSSHLPMKINVAGVIPPIFAGTLLMMPMTVAQFFAGDNSPDWLTMITTQLGQGKPLYVLFYVVLIVFFCFFYTGIQFNPEETAENLKKHNGIVPGIRPGARTAEYLDYVLTRLTVIGSAYLCLVCIIPEVVMSQAVAKSAFYIGGTSLLICVSVTLDTVTQIQSHLFAQQYEGLLKKSKLKGKRGRK